jgi:hypothetical protein
MCDTMVALKNSTIDNSVIFAKNSDREANEPHVGIFVERKTHKEKKVKCTYIEIEQVPETYACILFKPSWIWGAEMGVNEYGVVIGNEAIFTKLISKEKSLIGMDYVRLALERSKSAKEAVNVIIELLKKYGQGGKCGYTKNLFYDNSYLIADFEEAYVLETAGKDWVYKKVEDIYSISNSITLRDNYDESSFEKGIDFKEVFEKKLFTKISSGDFRRNITYSKLKSFKGKVDVKNMIDILRIHNVSKNFINGSLKSICMHSWSLISSETTGSFVVKLKDGEIKIYATLSPRPCSSIFKPIAFNEFLYSEDEVSSAENYWNKRRNLVLKISKDEDLKRKFEIARDELEKEILNAEFKKEILMNLWDKEDNLINEFLI